MPHSTSNPCAYNKRYQKKVHNYFVCVPPAGYGKNQPIWCGENNIAVRICNLPGEGDSNFDPWYKIIVHMDKNEGYNEYVMKSIFDTYGAKKSGSYQAFQDAVDAVGNDAVLRKFTNNVMDTFIGNYISDDLKTNGLHRGSLKAHVRTFCVNTHHVLNAIANNTHTMHGIKLANENKRFWIRNYTYANFIGMDGAELGALYRRFYIGAFVHDMMKPLIPGRDAGHEEGVFKYMMGEEFIGKPIIPWNTFVGDFKLEGYDKLAVACYSRYMGRFCDMAKKEDIVAFYNELSELVIDPVWNLSLTPEDVKKTVSKLFWELVLFNAIDVASGCIVEKYSDTPAYLQHASYTLRSGVMYLHLYAWCSDSKLYELMHECMTVLTK